MFDEVAAHWTKEVISMTDEPSTVSEWKLL